LKLAFFGTSPYEGECTSLSPRFWTKEQAVYYARILFGKNRIFKHKVLDFAELEGLPCFHRTIKQIEQAFLKGFLRFNHGWNHEVILQFYATLYISGDIADSRTWVHEWMIEEDKLMCSAEQFLALLNLPRFEFDETREHRLHHLEVSEAQLHMLMDPKLVGDACTESNPKNLAYDNKVVFYILCNSLTPTNQTESIGGIVANALHALFLGIWSDLPILFILNMAFAVENAQALKPYAPWIMYAIEQLAGKNFFCPHKPKFFTPTIRDTL
jgi:hypothetical protein